MKLEIPITGTILTEEPLTGDPNDPVRLIDIDLGNVTWQMVSVNLMTETMTIEVKGEHIQVDTGKVDAEGNPRYHSRPTTPQEKSALLQHARDLIEGHTKDELYVMAKSSKLKRPFKETK